jgi:GAF domain-containing protein
MGVPMIVDGEVVGQVTLDRHRVDEFTHQDISAALMFAHQAAVAVTNAQLYRKARDRADELSILNEIAMAATASMDVDVLVGQALDALLALFDLRGAGIALLDESGGKLSLQVQRTLAPHLVRAVECRSVEESEVCCEVIRRGHTMLLAAPSEDAEPDVHATALVPLLAPNAVLGLLVLQGGELDRPSSRQLALLEAIGRQIGIAVDRARLCAGVRREKGA